MRSRVPRPSRSRGPRFCAAALLSSVSTRGDGPDAYRRIRGGLFRLVVAELGRLCLGSGQWWRCRAPKPCLSSLRVGRHILRIWGHVRHEFPRDTHTIYVIASLSTDFIGGSRMISAVPRSYRLLRLRNSVYAFADTSAVASALCKAARRRRGAAGPYRPRPVLSPLRRNGSPHVLQNTTAGRTHSAAHAPRSAPRSKQVGSNALKEPAWAAACGGVVVQSRSGDSGVQS